VKLVETTEARKKILRTENIDYVLATKEENVKFSRKFPSWTSPVLAGKTPSGTFRTNEVRILSKAPDQLLGSHLNLRHDALNFAD
jgi:hypothetical protein